MAVRVRVRLRARGSDREVETSALANSGYEAVPFCRDAWNFYGRMSHLRPSVMPERWPRGGRSKA
ncbi:MAG TPA: hypothetical protein ENF34_02825 [Candidatus Bathyarchaeota archaeon]|nr:MAG: hypothetical protein DRO60_04955 [Candidatus Bathyarchaeota archaeon]HDJ26230.1 hypothetical protein [Candidatus Bathyarchaeota archaeon]